MAGINPVPLKDLKDMPFSLQEWMRSVNALLNPGGSDLIPWAQVSKSGSNLNEMVTRQHNDLQSVQGGAANDYFHLTSAQHTTLTALPTIASGTYTPTLSNRTNIGASTAYSCQYMRIGSVVTVSGRVDIDPVAGGDTVLGISLPIASNFTAANECAGAAECPEVASLSATILGDATNNDAILEFQTVDTVNRPFYFTFTYRII